MPPSAGTEQLSLLHLCSARDVSAWSRGAANLLVAPWVFSAVRDSAYAVRGPVIDGEEVRKRSGGSQLTCYCA